MTLLEAIGAAALLGVTYRLGVLAGMRKMRSSREVELRAARGAALALHRCHFAEGEVWTKYAHACEEWQRACWANEYRSENRVVQALLERF